MSYGGGSGGGGGGGAARDAGVEAYGGGGALSPALQHKLNLILKVLKREPGHAFKPMEGDENSVFAAVNKHMQNTKMTYTRLKRDDAELMAAIRNFHHVQMTGAPGEEKLRFKNPLFHLGVFVETADDVVNALEKVSPLDDQKTLRKCTNRTFTNKKDVWKPVDDAIFHCRAYGVFCVQDYGTFERYIALFKRDQAKRCRHYQLSGTLSVTRGQMRVLTTEDPRPEIRFMDAITIQGVTYRVNGEVVNAQNPNDVREIKRPHDITRQHGLSSTSNGPRPFHGAEKGNRRKYPITRNCFYLDRPFEGATKADEVGFKEGAPNDVRDLWAGTLQPAKVRLEKQQNLADRLAAPRAPRAGPAKRARRRKKQ